MTEQQIYQLTYFCGSAFSCQKAGHPEALQRAKYNVESYYSVVGIMQDLKRTVKLFQSYLPLFFENVMEIFDEKLKLNVNKYPGINNETHELLMNLPEIQGEFEFYDFVIQRFEDQYRKINTK